MNIRRTIRWFLSSKARTLTEMHNHVRRVLHAQRDLLTPEAIRQVEAALLETRAALDGCASSSVLDEQAKKLEAAANQGLRPYPYAGWRENIEVMLVAIAVAMAVRTFFLQPFKIPTGSMQPTLFGVTHRNLRGQPDAEFPSLPRRFWDGCVHGVFYHRVIAPEDCEVVETRHKNLTRFINKEEILIRERSGAVRKLTLWFSPDDRFPERAGLHYGQEFKKGEDIVKMVEVTGDHLFVDRLTYNFRPPKRGEIVVFKTEGIRMLPQNQFYIKRLVALGGERVRVGDDRHLVINGQRLDASTPRFENLYSFDGPPKDSRYSGHVNGTVSSSALFFPDAESEYPVPENQYLVMGDNTMNSFDSRGWGSFPRENVIGKANFVYWPISNRGGSRFGLGYR